MDVFFNEFNYSGAGDTEALYYRVENSFIDCVVKDRKGSPFFFSLIK